MICKHTLLALSTSLTALCSQVAAQNYWPSSDCAIVGASRQTVYEAHQWIEEFQFERSADIYLSSNGWYAITVGVVSRSESKAMIDRGIAIDALPSDAYCSSGSNFVRHIGYSAETPQAPPQSTYLWDPFDARPLSREERRYLQAALAYEGFYSGLLDGVWGQGSQSSLEDYTRREYGREPLNSDAAFSALLLSRVVRREGWQTVMLHGDATSLSLPMDQMYVSNNEPRQKNWKHTSKNIEVISANFDTQYMPGLHRMVEGKRGEYINDANGVYRVRNTTRWVTSVSDPSGSYYVRSELVNGQWATVYVSATDNGIQEFRLIVASIAKGYVNSLELPSSSVLMQNAGLLAAQLDTYPNGPNVSANTPVYGQPQPSPAPADNAEPEAGGTGTGFLINEDGVLLTNAHVVEGCSTIRVNGHRASLVTSSSIFDLAAVSVPNAALGTPLEFSQSSVGLNADITIAGYPLHGLLGGLNVGRGSVSALKGLRGDEVNFQISAPVQPGNSGGPVVDRLGNVVGVVVSKLDVVEVAGLTGDIAQNVNFAVRGDLAKVFLSSNGIKFSETKSDAQIPVEAEALAQRLQKSTHLIECGS